MGVGMRRVIGECEGTIWGRWGGVGEDDPGKVAFGRRNFGIRCSGAGRGDDGWLERERVRGGRSTGWIRE